MDGLEFGGLLMVFDCSMIHVIVLGIVILNVVVMVRRSFLRCRLFDYFLVKFTDAVVWDPFIVPSVQWLVMDVVLIRALVFLFLCSVVIFR